MSDVYQCDVCEEIKGGTKGIDGFRSPEVDHDYGDYRDVLEPGEFDMCKECAKEMLEALQDNAE